MKKALIITNAASMVYLFNKYNIEILQNAGYEVHVACNFIYGNTTPGDNVRRYKEQWAQKGIITHQIDFLRTPFSLKSFNIYRETRKLIKNGDFDIIHCHTPIVSVFTRLAAKSLRKKGTKIFYTAHGFHFYKGSPKFNWLTYYPIEKLLAPYTDVLITINREDYERALEKFRTRKIVYVNGIGVDVEKFRNMPCDRQKVRESLGIPQDAVTIVSVGELCTRKNHKTAIEALAKCENKNIRYVIAGIGKLENELREFAEKQGVGDRVHLIGFCANVAELYKACDIFVFPSYSEGLPVALMEAMACGLPTVVSDIRGNNDLIKSGEGGFLCGVEDVEAYRNAIERLSSDQELRMSMGKHNSERINDFDKSIVINELKSVFSEEGLI